MRFNVTLHVFGMDIPVTAEVVEHDKWKRRASLLGHFPEEDGSVEAHVHVEDLGDGCIVNFDHRVTPPTWAAEHGITPAVIARMVQEHANHGLENTRTILEGGHEGQVTAMRSFVRNELAPPK